MGIIKYSEQSFLEAMRPGISALVVSAFEKKLEKKLNGIVQEVYDELKKELPDKIESAIHRSISMLEEKERIEVIVDLRNTEPPKDKP